jgi:hypothetical protein
VSSVQETTPQPFWSCDQNLASEPSSPGLTLEDKSLILWWWCHSSSSGLDKIARPRLRDVSTGQEDFHSIAFYKSFPLAKSHHFYCSSNSTRFPWEAQNCHDWHGDSPPSPWRKVNADRLGKQLSLLGPPNTHHQEGGHRNLTQCKSKATVDRERRCHTRALRPNMNHQLCAYSPVMFQRTDRNITMGSGLAGICYLHQKRQPLPEFSVTSLLSLHMQCSLAGKTSLGPWNWTVKD